MIQYRQQLRFHNIKNDRQQLQKSSFRLKSGNVLNLRFVRNHPKLSGIYKAKFWDFWETDKNPYCLGFP